MYIFPFLSRISLPETFHAIMKKTTSEVCWRKANITKADFLSPDENIWMNWFFPSTPFILITGYFCLPLSLLYIFKTFLKFSQSRFTGTQ